MSKGATAHNLTGTAVETGLILMAVGCPLALGGVHSATILGTLLVSVLTLTMLWLRRRRLRVSWYALLLLMLCAYTALQLVPLPIWLLHSIAPATADILQVSLSLPLNQIGWHPISLDPNATHWAFLKLGSCTLAFIVAQNFLYRRRRRDRVLMAIVIGTTFAALLGFLGAVATPGKVLLFYTPSQAPAAGGLISTSFVNPNHGAAFLMIGALLAFGLAMAAEDLQQRILLALAGIVMGAGVFLTLSVGGIAAFGLGLFVMAVLLFSGGEKSKVKRSVAFFPAVGALVLTLSSWLAYGPIVEEIRHKLPHTDAGLGKLSLWPSALKMLWENAWTGVGRGAFYSTFPRYISGEVSTKVTYTHLENQYLHLPIEWGIPIGVGIILASIVALYLWLRKGHRDPPTAAMAGATVAVAAQNLVDFSLELLGIAVMLAIVTGTLSAREAESVAHRQRKKRKGSGQRSSRVHIPWRNVIVLGMTALLMALALVSLITPLPRAADEVAKVIALTKDKDAPINDSLSTIRNVVNRHPSFYLPYLVAARLSLRQNDRAALRWLNRAIYNYPANPELHLQTAEALLRFGQRHQAMLQYRLAMQHGGDPTFILNRALKYCRNFDELTQLLPEKPEPHRVAVQQLLTRNRRALAAQIAKVAKSRWPGAVAAQKAAIYVDLAMAEPRAAERNARRLVENRPTEDSYRLWTLAAQKLGNRWHLEALQEARTRFPKKREFVFDLAIAYLAGNNGKKAMSLVDELLAKETQAKYRIRGHRLLARIHRSAGRSHRATYEEKQALKILESQARSR